MAGFGVSTEVVPLADAGRQPLLLHQPNDPLPAHGLVPFDEVVVDPRAAVVPAASRERSVHQDFQPAVFLRPCRLGSGAPRIEPTGRHAEHPTQCPYGNGGPLRVDRREDCAWCLAKRAETLFSRSRSMRSSRVSLRSRANSSRSSFISPLLPCVRSARAWVTHCARAEAVRSSSRATAPIVLPSSRTSAHGAVLELLREPPPGSPAQCVFRHAGHRIHLSERVHEIGSSPPS